SYLSNIRQLHPPEFPMALSVTWSLAVEEQFYLLWPWLIWSAEPLNRRRWIVLTIAFGAIAKLAWFFVTGNLVGVRYLTPCCVDEFGWGALVAVLLREQNFDEIAWKQLRDWGLRVALPVAGIMAVAHGRIHPLLADELVSQSTGWAVAACIAVCLSNKPS